MQPPPPKPKRDLWDILIYSVEMVVGWAFFGFILLWFLFANGVFTLRDTFIFALCAIGLYGAAWIAGKLFGGK